MCDLADGIVICEGRWLCTSSTVPTFRHELFVFASQHGHPHGSDMRKLNEWMRKSDDDGCNSKRSLELCFQRRVWRLT